ncbi:CMRF35-like molecule 8 [Nerophis ophidion]|uniref:CMRF35-like molecule 8 n=1 Tax=Nerophis ophidion TaxID=159077 RepID=UPI002AE0241B|nr:CMRF35-like molecule 8 [Nerophis ophidion]
MDIFFLFFAFLIGGLKAETMSVTGVSGQNITITCSSKNRDDNNKYFCKDPCEKDDDILISSSVDKDKWDTNKYSIRDEKSIFYVTIFHLKKEDSGTYMCGVEVPWGRDPLEIVVITVKEAITPEREPTKLPEQVHPKTSSSINETKTITVHKHHLTLFMAAITCTVALVCVCLCTLVLLTALKKHKRKISSVYETMMPAVIGEAEGHGRSLSLERITHPDPAVGHRESSSGSLNLNEYLDLDPSLLEEHVYHSISRKNIP